MKLQVVVAKVAGTRADEPAVEALYRELMDGWNEGKGNAFAGPFAEGADLIGFDGTHLSGRQEIAAFHQPLFDNWLKGTRLVGKVKSVRFLSDDVALIHATGDTVMRGRSEPSAERHSIQTLVAAKRNGEWRLEAFQNTRVRSMGRTTGNAILWLLTDLLWRIFGRTR